MKRVFFFAAVVTLFASCDTPRAAMYSWYDSEDATYQYTKRNTEERLNAAMAQYELVVKQQKGTRQVVPPGINAEYGFLLCKAGKNEEGLVLLNEEMRLYPESEKYISRIVKQLKK
jgi:hypothetical protein